MRDSKLLDYRDKISAALYVLNTTITEAGLSPTTEGCALIILGALEDMTDELIAEVQCPSDR